MRLYPDAPVVAAGAIILRQDHLLLIRRANDPGRGWWSVPAGAVELGETTAEAARRETYEECGVQVEIGPLVSAYDVIERDDEGKVRYHYVIVYHLAHHVSGTPRAASDALEARWVPLAELPGLEMFARLKAVIAQALGA